MLVLILWACAKSGAEADKSIHECFSTNGNKGAYGGAMHKNIIITKEMTAKEAIYRIQDHMKVHKIGEYPHILLKDALDMAISVLSEKDERENPKPLTLDELRQMDGEPVFLVDLVHKSDPEEPDLWGGWIVFSHHSDNGFIPRSHGWFGVSGYGKTWLAYRNRPKEDTK